jgi:ABC-2 type transport system ATP-binding protein
MNMERRTAVDVKGVRQEFAKFTALDGVDLQVLEGETFGLLGPNGAGKSTLISIIAFLAKPSAGEARVFGRRDRSLIGLAPQENSFYGELTVWENLEFFGRLYNVRARELGARAAETLALLNLEDKRNARAETLSGGMKRRLNVACALMHEPKLLILDEPSVGLDPTSRRVLWGVIQRLRGKGMAILVTTHYMDEADRLCDRIAVLQKGKIVAEGTPAQLKKRVLAEIRLTLTEAPTKRDVELCEKCGVDGSTIILKTLDPENELPKLTQRFGKRLKSVEVKKPSLEDFFLQLTEGAK